MSYGWGWLRVRRAETLEWLVVALAPLVLAYGARGVAWLSNIGPNTVDPRLLGVAGIVPAAVSVANALRWGLRFQVVPLWIADIILLLVSLHILSLQSWLVRGALITFALLSAVSLLAVPPFFMPPPGAVSHRPIGSRHVHWRAPGERKHGGIVWFPADHDGTKHSRLLGSHGGRMMHHFFAAMKENLPSWFIAHLATLETNSFTDVDIAAPEGSKWPVVVFSHGMYGIPHIHSHICESIAARGAFVIAIAHTDGSTGATLSEDGELAHEFLHVPDPPKDANDDERAAARRKQIDQRVSDVREALAYLKLSPFANSIDLEHVTIAGHSFGAATVVASVAEIPAITAGVGLDGWYYPLRDTLERTTSEQLAATAWGQRMKDTVVLFLNSELWQWKANIERMENATRASGNKWSIATLLGTTHHHYDEAALWFARPIATKSLKLGPADLGEVMNLCARAIHRLAVLNQQTRGAAKTVRAEIDGWLRDAASAQPNLLALETKYHLIDPVF